MIEGFLCRCYNVLLFREATCEDYVKLRRFLELCAFLWRFQAHNSESGCTSDLCKDNDHVRKADKEEVQQLLAPGTLRCASELNEVFFVFLDFRLMGSD